MYKNNLSCRKQKSTNENGISYNRQSEMKLQIPVMLCTENANLIKILSLTHKDGMLYQISQSGDGKSQRDGGMPKMTFGP